ncbi:MAG: T9SS type A sorting domain-containing protein [Bacteroidia bacterium]|nr:T9SS type A sorting domain-containing protein [Bacteroidia bacterium]MDW8347314.1 T9SS type A sorting domain-containing protein [Bacteroidia bacterium]
MKIHFIYFFALASLSYAQSISGIINQYYEATAINLPANSITLSDATGLNIDDRVLIIQMKGASYNTSNSASYGDITAINEAGLYEFNNICSISGNDIVLKYTLLNNYGAGGNSRLQVIKVPQYTNPTVDDNLTCQPWNGATGGVLVLEATGTLTLNDTITVWARGFKGGAYKNWTSPVFTCPSGGAYTGYVITFAASAGNNHGAMKGEGIADTISGCFARGKQINGGGGGNNHNAGGGGGGNYGAGGVGGNRTNHSPFTCFGNVPGVAGISLSTYGYSAANNRIFMGGGGGAGHGNNLQSTAGGDGGGIIIIRANAIDGNNNYIIADGRHYYPAIASGFGEGTPGAVSDGGGGGGAGGVIILDVNNVLSTTHATARGGRGSNASWGDINCFGAGGGGGGGAIWISAPAIYPLLTTNVSGGLNGVRGPSAPASCDGTAGGAAPGSNGAVLFNYVAPINTVEFCTTVLPLTTNVLKGKYQEGQVYLQWSNPENVFTKFILERSQNGTFSPIIEMDNHQPLQTIDKHPYQGKNMYRLQMVHKDGKITYSNIIEIYTQYSALSSCIYPNPVLDKVNIECYTADDNPTEIQVFDVLGNHILSFTPLTNAGKNVWTIDTHTWASGVYYVHIIQGKERLMHKLVKM